MRYLVVNDPHLDITAPSHRRTDDYLAACLRKLNHILELCDAHRVSALVCTGDWFHKKSPQAVPHRLVRHLVSWATRLTHDMRVPLLTVLGNHDVPFNDTSTAAVQRQPVSLLLEIPGVGWLDEAPVMLGEVVFVGRSYRPDVVLSSGDVQVDRSQFVIPELSIGSGAVVVQVTHASVHPHAPIWPHCSPADVAAVSTAMVCHTGHIHEDLGIHRIERPEGPLWWTNVGSMTRGSLSEETLTRQPKVLLVEVEPGEVPQFTELVLPHPPAEEIYDVASYREEKVQHQVFTAWTARLREELHAATTQEKTLTDLVQESALDSRGRDLALRFLHEAGA